MVLRGGSCAALAAASLCCVLEAGNALAATQTLPADDTFLNSRVASNNCGASASIFTGRDGQGGAMRGLVRFVLPPGLAGRITITSASLTMTTRGVNPVETTLPSAGNVSLFAVAEAWSEGNGVGNTSTTFTGGQTCLEGNGIVGATWNQANCPSANWSLPGGVASASASAVAFSPAAIGAPVTWQSVGMTSDVQAWNDVTVPNHGWLLGSDTECVSTPGGCLVGVVQRFHSAESLTGPGPSLTIGYDCKAGFLANGTNCTTCTAAANAACVISQPGNTCVDSGPPSTVHTCVCGHPAYVGVGNACVDRNECLPNHCPDGGDVGSACVDHAAPTTGYGCLCSSGYSFNGTTCVNTDACIPNHCRDGGDLNAICVDHTPPATDYGCVCSSGYVPEGPTCVSKPGHFFPLAPCRLVDTRLAVGPLGGPILTSGVERTFPLVNTCGIPAVARALSVSLIAVNPTGSGYLVLYPTSGPPGSTSSLSFGALRTRANNAVVSLNAQGELQVRAFVTVVAGPAEVHFVLDVNGYFE